MVTVLALISASQASQVSASECWVDGAQFAAFPDGHTYSVQDVDESFDNAKGPYKMIAGGDVGEPLTIVEGDAIRASFPKGRILGTHTGFSFYDVTHQGAEEAWMTYRVKFSGGFEWTEGGKLPGLCGGPSDGTGRPCPTGCSSVAQKDGFSTRLMWRADGAIVTYAYYPDKPRSIRCGEDWVWDATLESGRWYEIAMRVRLNSVDGGTANSDGSVEAWLDGKKVLGKSGVRLRYNDRVLIDRAYLTSYVGGSSVDLFAPSKDQYALFDEFKAGTGPDIGVCNAQIPAKSDATAGETDADAPKRVFDFELYNEGRGWDVPGNIARYRTPRAAKSASAKLRYCHGKCKHDPGCVAFTLYGNGCYSKSEDNASNKVRWYGQGRSGWRWYYKKIVDDGPVVLDQSGTACGVLGERCCYRRGFVAPQCTFGAECAEEGSCLCSDSICVRNIEHCPAGAVCDQSAALQECGALNQPCCDGTSCDEEAVLENRTVVALACTAEKCQPL